VATPTPTAKGRLAANQRSRHAAVHVLVARGLTISMIARVLHLDRKTVRRYARNEQPPGDGVPSARRRRSLLDPYMAHLARRWTEGCRNAAALWREVRAQGFRGSATTVRAALAPFRDQPLPPSARRPLAVRTVVGLLVRRPADLTEREQQRLAALLARSDALAAAHRRTRAFATLLHERRGADLDAWIAEVKAGDSRELRAFAEGLERDRAAVVAGLTQEWSSGPVEGHVNRVKLIKRQMFGRATLDLLRQRVLLAG
jgi:transposase